MLNLHKPLLTKIEIKEVQTILKSSWISYAGKNVEIFEDEFAKFVGSKHAISCINGTSALHLSLLSSNIKKKTEILLPCVSFISTANIVLYNDCYPVFFDIDENINLNISSVLEFLNKETFQYKKKLFNKKSKRQISAIIVVHAFGRVCDFKKIKKICNTFGIIIIEDAAGSLGSYFSKKKHTGTLGDFGCFSFNANKIITSGGGGMIVTQNPSYAKKAKHLSTQAKKNNFYFEHDDIGYNYRLPNILATIGLFQLRRIKKILKYKKQLRNNYKKIFNKNKFFNIIHTNEHENNWLNILKINITDKKILKQLLFYLNKNGIESRPIWQLLHKQKKMKNFQKYKITKAEKIINTHICLPSGLEIKNIDIKKIYSYIEKFQKIKDLK